MALGPQSETVVTHYVSPWWPVARWVLLAAAIVGLLVGTKCYGDRRAATAAGLARAAVLDSAAAVFEGQKRALEGETRRQVEAARALASAALEGQRRMEREVAELRANRPSIRVSGATLTIRTADGQTLTATVDTAVAAAIGSRLVADSIAISRALGAAAGLGMALDTTRLALAAQVELTRLADSALVKRSQEVAAIRAVKTPRYGLKGFALDAAKVAGGALLGLIAGLILGH